MKVHIYDWAGNNLLKNTEYSHRQDLEVSDDEFMRIVKNIYDRGLNVMLRHTGQDTVLFVDNERFQQR